MNKEKILTEIDILLKPIVEEQKTYHDSNTEDERYHRIGGQISVLNNLKHKIERGKFD
jgi:hypothetical protein